MNDHTTIIQVAEADVGLASTLPVARRDPPPLDRAPTRYGEGQRPNPLAMLASLAIVGGLLSAMLAIDVVMDQKVESKLTVVDLRSEPPPPPPPPRQQERPVEQVQAPSPVVAPRPLVTTLPSPIQIATSPVPPPRDIPVSGTGPPSPAPPAPAPAPAVESVGDLSSTMIAAPPPRYPHESRRKREQGTVVLMVVLAVDGSVADISVSQSSGFERLDRAALGAVRRWRWSPTRRGGTAVMVRGFVEIPFILQQ